MDDVITIRRVANGWVLRPGGPGVDEFTHVAMTVDQVAEHVRRWANATGDANRGTTRPRREDPA